MHSWISIIFFVSLWSLKKRISDFSYSIHNEAPFKSDTDTNGSVIHEEKIWNTKFIICFFFKIVLGIKPEKHLPLDCKNYLIFHYLNININNYTTQQTNLVSESYQYQKTVKWIIFIK